MRKLGILLTVLFLCVGASHASTVLDGEETISISDISRGSQTNTIAIEGEVAADGASTAKPVVVGHVAETTVPTAVSDGDVVNRWCDEYGRCHIVGSNPSTGSTDATIIAPVPVANGAIVCVDDTMNADGEDFDCTVSIGSFRKVALLIDNTETADANDCTYTLDVDVSGDGTTYVDTDMVDSTGVDSPVASVQYSATGTDTLYLPYGMTAQKMLVTLTEDGNCDANDYMAIDVQVSYQK